MNDLIDNVRTTGQILLDEENILDPTLDVIELRRRVGMVFQRPTPFPKRRHLPGRRPHRPARNYLASRESDGAAELTASGLAGAAAPGAVANAP
jgi:hypothetical protein